MNGIKSAGTIKTGHRTSPAFNLSREVRAGCRSHCPSPCYVCICGCHSSFSCSGPTDCERRRANCAWYIVSNMQAAKILKNPAEYDCISRYRTYLCPYMFHPHISYRYVSIRGNKSNTSTKAQFEDRSHRCQVVRWGKQTTWQIWQIPTLAQALSESTSRSSDFVGILVGHAGQCFYLFQVESRAPSRGMRGQDIYSLPAKAGVPGPEEHISERKDAENFPHDSWHVQ